MPTIEIQPKGFFATLLHYELTKRDKSMKDLSEMTGLSYEHIRKLIRGLSYPSATLVKLLHVKLKLSMTEMDEAVTKDRIEHKYGKTITQISGRSPHQVRFAPVLEKLDKIGMIDTGYNILSNLAKGANK